MTAPNTWLTTAEVAERAKCCAATVLRAARTGHLDGHRRGGAGHWRFRSADVDVWLAGPSGVVVAMHGRAS